LAHFAQPTPSEPLRGCFMFEYSFIPNSGGHRPMMMAGASLGEAVLIGIAIITPMFFVQTLPQKSLLSAIFLPSVPLSRPAPPPVVAKAQPVHPRPVRAFNPNALVTPVAIPKEVAVIEEAPAIDPRLVEGGIPGGLPAGLVTGGTAGLFNGGIAMAPPPPPPPPAQVAKAATSPPPVVTRQVSVGGDVQAAMLVKQVPPVYPLAARRARITGSVILTAVIATDGTIKNLSVVSGHPLLVQAAMKVVPQWIYRPTILNGEPMEVITQIEVRFRLQ
jgi:protein TonB